MDAQPTLADLKGRIGRLDLACAVSGQKDQTYSSPAAASASSHGLTLGFGPVDNLLPSGAKSYGVHQIASTRAGDPAAPLSFACAMLSRAMGEKRRALVVREAGAVRETGPVYPPGFQAFGLDPARLTFIEASNGPAALRIVDEALRAAAVEVLVLDLRNDARLADLRITRRFNLSARASHAMVLLVTPGLDATSAAITRWSVASASSQGRRRRLGPPVFDIALTRNRLGATGQWVLAWDADEHAFAPPAALDTPVVRPPVHRQNETAQAASRAGPAVHAA
jgi:protein ImuA